MDTTNININVDSDLKDKAQPVFDALGIDLSTAVNILLRIAVYQQETLANYLNKIPTLAQKKDRRAAFGCLKGMICVPSDFNEPLDDFKEYMQ